MPADSAATLSPSIPLNGRARAHIGDHPVYRALPPDTRRRLLEESTEIELRRDAPQPLDRDHLWFVLSGVLGAFPADSEVCVAQVVSGAVYGWEHALGFSGSAAQVRPVLDVRVFRVPAAAAREALGYDWLARFVALQAVQRLTFLEQEIRLQRLPPGLGTLGEMAASPASRRKRRTASPESGPAGGHAWRPAHQHQCGGAQPAGDGRRAVQPRQSFDSRCAQADRRVMSLRRDALTKAATGLGKQRRPARQGSDQPSTRRAGSGLSVCEKTRLAFFSPRPGT